ncbi:MAG: DnaJ domain-containing protein [Verrucomicrobia bacterium]|nr:DnaJ domain-containing protein [Cytophagales bacterium]
MKNYYQVLGVKTDASLEEIKAAYRKLTLKFHPDRNQGDKFFEEHFKEIVEAYETLSFKDRRENFDLQLKKFNDLSSNHNSMEDIRNRERDIAKQEIDLRKKIQDAEIEKIVLQKKLYEQFEREKDEIFTRLSEEKNELLKRINDQTSLADSQRVSSGKRQKVVMFACMLITAVAIFYAFQVAKPAQAYPSYTNNGLEKIKSSLADSSSDTSAKTATVPAKTIANEKAANNSTPTVTRNNNGVPPGNVKTNDQTNASEAKFATTNSQANILEQHPEASWARDVSGNYNGQKVVVVVPARERVELITDASQLGFYYVSFNGSKGYIHKDFLDLK